ncbi:MAG: KGK domain-containing protein [Microcoleaceae cyanobacterium]
MTDPIEVKNCADDEIFSFMDETCKFNRFKYEVWQSIYTHSGNITQQLNNQLGVKHLNIGHNLFTEGKECEVLKPYKGWQKGKIKINITIEFIPDEPEPVEENGHQQTDNLTESPLDEIRQQLTENN